MEWRNGVHERALGWTCRVTGKLFPLHAGKNPLSSPMQPTKRPRGRPPKKRRKAQITKDQALHERSQAPSPSPSRAQHSDADVESSGVITMDWALRERSQAPSPSPSCAQHSDADVESSGAGMP